MALIVFSIIFPLIAYALGSIPFSLIIVHCTKGIDLRQFGSGNIGATNARRAAGTAIGVVALIGDGLKGALPAWIGLQLAPFCTILPTAWYAPIIALFAITGHIFPVYFKFKPSGKGIATTMGCFLMLSPLTVAIALIAFLLVVVVFRRVSLGSLAGIILLAPTVWLITRNPALLVCSLVIMVIIIWRHKANILRLRQGKEPTFNDPLIV
jgi:glycerol-3-phosphate acyltransferase PlsY